MVVHHYDIYSVVEFKQIQASFDQGRLMKDVGASTLHTLYNSSRTPQCLTRCETTKLRMKHARESLRFLGVPHECDCVFQFLVLVESEFCRQTLTDLRQLLSVLFWSSDVWRVDSSIQVGHLFEQYLWILVVSGTNFCSSLICCSLFFEAGRELVVSRPVRLIWSAMERP